MELLAKVSEAIGLSKLITASGAGVVAVIINLLLSKFKVKDKVLKWLNGVEFSYENWLKQIPIIVARWLHNLGISVTAFFNNIPILDKIWERAGEPIFVILFEFIGTLSTLTLQYLSDAVMEGIKSFIKALKSDNKNFKKK